MLRHTGSSTTPKGVMGAASYGMLSASTDPKYLMLLRGIMGLAYVSSDGSGAILLLLRGTHRSYECSVVVGWQYLYI